MDGDEEHGTAGGDSNGDLDASDEELEGEPRSAEYARARWKS